MMESTPNEEHFSPMRTARAGRRAGKHVAIVDPASRGALQQEEPEEGEASSQQKLQLQQQLLGQVPDGQRQQQQDVPQQLQPRPPAVQQHQQQQQQLSGPPAKRVGFDLQVRAPGENECEGSSSGQRFAGVSRRKQEQLQREEMQEVKHRSKYDEKAVERVSDIPELEEEGKEDITRVVAHAPRDHAQRVQGIVELEQDQGWLPSRPDNEDIDLSLLTARLLPSEQVFEPSDVWDYDLLFSQLKAELQNEGPAGEGSKDDKEELRQI